MKKIKYLLFCLLFSGILTVQGSNIPLSETARNIIFSNEPWLMQSQNGLELVAERQSAVGHHFLFIQRHQGIPVYDASIKINLSTNGNVLSLFSHLFPITQTLAAVPNNNMGSAVYYKLNETFVAAYLRVEKNSRGESIENIYAPDGKLLHSHMLDLMLRKDTLVQSKVFNPDPLTSAGKSYGQDGKYKNNSGADSPELTAELKTVQLTLGISNDTFYTSSPYAIIMDLESPAQTVFSSTTAAFDFTRSNPFFREMNCLYHIEQSRKYYTSIGLPFTGMEPILVDPTAYQGQDQSRFSFYGSKRALFFGTGGVPDAEDADVIVHESTHGINNYISPNSDNGSERLAVEEANCDFMACQYSRNINTYNWRQVFNWDGHNEFWDGRDASSPNVYPTDLSSDFYVSSLIWSSMLNDISIDIGRDVTTKLLFTSVYSYANYMSMQRCADLLMQTDSILYGNMHFAALKYHLTNRGFSVFTGLNPSASQQLPLRLINSEGFANGESDLQILLNNSGEFKATLYSLNGVQLESFVSSNGILVLKPNTLGSGIYLIQVKNAQGQTATSKIVRY